MAFFGPGPSDIVCIGEGGRIVASGTMEEMSKLAQDKNYGMARLTPLRYAIIPRSLVPFLSDEDYGSMVQVTRLANQDLLASIETEPRSWTEIVKRSVCVCSLPECGKQFRPKRKQKDGPQYCSNACKCKAYKLRLASLSKQGRSIDDPNHVVNKLRTGKFSR